MQACGPQAKSKPSLYTAEERKRRDTTTWTLVQGVLAPVQFLVFLVSLGLVLRYLTTGQGQMDVGVITKDRIGGWIRQSFDHGRD